MAIALVGVQGAFAAAAAATISPAFGQSTTASNLLVAWISASGGTNIGAITTAQSGWVQAADNTKTGTGQGAQAALWYKANCGSSETAPTFTSSAATRMQAQLGEFSGVATSSPLDRTGVAGGTASPLAVTAAAVDAESGELQATAYDWNLISATVTTADTYGSNATAINLGNDDSSNVAGHARFSYAVTTGNSIADTDSGTSTGTINQASAVIASFKQGSVTVTPGNAGLVLAGFAPTVNAGLTVTPSTTGLSLVGHAPNVTMVFPYQPPPVATPVGEVSVSGTAKPPPLANPVGETRPN